MQPQTPPHENPPTLEADKTPRPPRAVGQTPVEEESPTMATPRPQLKRKTSKFIEHIDTTPEKGLLLAPPKAPVFATVEPISQMVPLLEPPTRKFLVSP